ncbi:pdz domain containing protein [Echinococcus multilocularis]|uniref:Pdz domain containing protein n=1 Tax=Echinococcus multilocularis TaxID=6211 RepID=A0A068YA13_ECHMU|nr:pdz domain containing protein [Echinococcus multilocularis]
MNAYLGCVAGTDPRGSFPMAGRHRPTALAATLDRLSSTSAAATTTNAHMGSRLHGRNNSFDAMHTVVLTRSQVDKPWGFRIQGGQDYNLQLTVKKTQPGSPAEGQLHCGDEIHEINGQDTRTLSHSQATESIKAAGKDLKLTISKSLESDFLNLKVQPQNSFGR